MARVNLRAAFMAGVGSPVAAHQVFADRVDEVEGFLAALANLRADLDAAQVSPVVDRARGRRNVLVFYGVGGIGKTTLSQELERRFLAREDEGGIGSGPSDAVAVRIDLADAIDVETLLFRLRAGLGRLGPRWQAFDLALSCYWARAHPGEPLQEFLDTSPMIRRITQRVDLGQQIASNVESLVPVGMVGLPGVAQRAGTALFRAVRERIRQGRLLSGCDLLAELIEADADHETLSFFPYLLAWDLERLASRTGTQPSVCVFLDTFEAVTEQADRGVERMIQRCVYLMPNVLFVVTGRNRLEWADLGAGDELDFCGPERWPNLHFTNHSVEPRQHLVGYLSDVDAEHYLSAALTTDGQPVIAADVRQRILEGAHGLPLYLDLSVSHYVELLARGDAPTPEDFGGSFTAVASRTLRDLAGEERDLVRTAALVERFDPALLRAGQPRLSDGRIARFLRRPFLLHDDSYRLPYSLHGALRMALGDADSTLPDGWSDRDRREAAQRLLQEMSARAADAADRFELTHVLEAGLGLAHDEGVFDDWLVRATEDLVEAGQWTTLPAGFPDPDGNEPANADLDALVSGVRGVVLRREGHAPEAVDVLGTATGLVDADSAVGRFVGLHLAHALRNVGDYARAASLYRNLQGTEFGDTARYWLCDYDYLNGRFRTALDTLASWHGRTPADESERLRLVGHIARVNARFADAAATYESAIELAAGEDLAAAEAKAQTNLAQTRCWDGAIEAVGQAAERARELLDLVPNPVELVKLRASEAVVWALAESPDEATAALSETRHLADEIGYRGGHNLADVATILLDALHGDHEHAARTLGELRDRTESSGGNFYWVPIVAQWLPDLAPRYGDQWHGIEWLDRAETLQRWAHIAGR